MASIPDPRDLLSRLDGEPADAIESQFVEFKSWNLGGASPRTQLREVRETVVAFANASGGLLLLGVEDGKRTRAEAIHGTAGLDPNSLVRNIHSGTDPPILVDISELDEPEGRVVAIRVPPGVPPHTTTDGVAKLRVGKESKPLTGAALTRLISAQGWRDPTAEVLPDVQPGDLDPHEIGRLREMIAASDHGAERAERGDLELLEALGLISPAGVTLAAVLLVGSPPTLARCAPRHEVIFTRRRNDTDYDLRRDLRQPLLALLGDAQQLLDQNLRLTTIQPAGFQRIEIPNISWLAAREALLNALTHRDYFLNQSIHLDLFRDRIEIVSPGGFIGGVTAENVLRHPPVRRNPLLADVLQHVGLVERLGVGVGRIFEELLTLGKDIPRYEADESHVRLVLPTPTHEGFARFVQETRAAGATLNLDDLLVLRSVAHGGALDRWSAADVLQLAQEEAAERLVSLRERGFLTPQGRGRATTYRFADRYRELEPAGGGAGEAPSRSSESVVRRMILAMLAEHDYLANADIRQLAGLSRGQVYQLMKQLREEGLVEARGWGRGAHYVLVRDPSK